MKEGTANALDAELEKLVREIPPPRDLWPDVVRGIVRAPRAPLRSGRATWMAYAASAAGLCLAAALAWVLVHGRLAAIRPAATVASTTLPAAGANLGEPRDPRYLAARAELERTFDRRLAQLDPATRAQIVADLQAIRRAREDIRKALAAQPDSAVLEQLLASSLHDEFDLYEDVVRTTQPTTART